VEQSQPVYQFAAWANGVLSLLFSVGLHDGANCILATGAVASRRSTALKTEITMVVSSRHLGEHDGNHLDRHDMAGQTKVLSATVD